MCRKTLEILFVVGLIGCIGVIPAFSKTIEWGYTQRFLSQGPVEEISKKMVDSILKDYGVDLSGKKIMATGYKLPEGWREATKGVDRLVAMNGGGLKHDPATVLNAKIFENLTGIHIDLIEMKESMIWPKILSLFMARAKDVDLIYSPIPHLQVPHLGAAKWIEPINELWPDQVQQMFPKEMLGAVRGLDGSLYSSPTICWGMYLYYRPSWLEKAGVKVPETYQDLILASKKLATWAKGNLGAGYAGMIHSSANSDHLLDLLCAATYAQDKRVIRDGKPMVDPKAWKVLTDLWLRGGMSKDSINYEWSDSPEVFARGKAGFTITSGVYMKKFSNPSFAGEIQGDWDVTVLPAWEGVGKRGITPASSNVWLINVYISPKNKAACKLWIDYIRSFQYNFHELYVEGNESPLPVVYDHPKVRQDLMYPEVRKETLSNQVAELFPAGFMDAAERLREYLHRVILGEVDPETARQKIQAYWDELQWK